MFWWLIAYGLNYRNGDFYGGRRAAVRAWTPKQAIRNLANIFDSRLNAELVCPRRLSKRRLIQEFGPL